MLLVTWILFHGQCLILYSDNLYLISLIVYHTHLLFDHCHCKLSVIYFSHLSLLNQLFSSSSIARLFWQDSVFVWFYTHLCHFSLLLNVFSFKYLFSCLSWCFLVLLDLIDLCKPIFLSLLDFCCIHQEELFWHGFVLLVKFRGCFGEVFLKMIECIVLQTIFNIKVFWKSLIFASSNDKSWHFMTAS